MSQEEIVVPRGWSTKPLKDMCDFFVPMRDKPQEFGGNIPWLRIDEINGKFVDGINAKFRVSEKTIKDMKLRVYPIGTVLYSCSATVGKCSITKEKLTTNQTFIGIFPKEKIFNEYLYYFLKSRIKELTNLGKGTTIAYISRKKFENLNIIFPELMKQKKLAQKLDHILGELEVKKEQILSLIEQNKQRIDFFEKNWINYIISTLIPKKEIPNGWSLLPLSEICNVERGKFGHRPRNDPAFYGGKYPFIQTGDVARSNGRVSKFSQTLNENGFKVSRMFPKGTVVITIAANIGDTAILEFDSCFPDSLIGITPITGKTIAEYVEYALRLYQKDLTRDASQGTQKNINYDFLKPLLIPIPKTITEQENIVRKIKSAEEKFQSQKKQFENIKNNYESKIKYINHIQSSVLDSAFSGKLIQ